MARVIKVTVNEEDHAALKAAAARTHGGDVAGYVRTAALEKARGHTGPILTREGVERLVATLNGAQDRRQA